MWTLGISAYYHDSSVTLLKDGRIVAAAHEERFTRKKHDAAFPRQSLEYCLLEGGVQLSDLDAIVYYEKPFLKFDRILETYIHAAPFGLKYFVSSFPLWIKHKLFLRQELSQQLKKIDARFDTSKILFSEHHLSHAASAFYPSPFSEAVVLTLDGVGEWATTSVGYGSGHHLVIQKEVHFPHSLGFLYSALTTFCGFKVNSGEYKLMGLAPYGSPKFKDGILKELIKINEDGSFVLNLKYFSFIKGTSMFSGAMEDLFKVPARRSEDSVTQVYMDIAASIQSALEEILIHLTRGIYKQYKSENLCMAGGVALNCVANSKILSDGITGKNFKNLWIQPAAGDAGGSLGAALAAYHLHFKKPRVISAKDSMRGSYLGPSYSDQQIDTAIQKFSLQDESEQLSFEQICKKTSKALAQGKTVGWFQGRMEFGPRALGARSILADARSPEMQKKLNLQVKFRESFRPFAPVVLEEKVSEWFDFDQPSQYMLFVAHVKKNLQFTEPEEIKNKFGIERLNFARSQLPSITHLDYSARLQTVSRENSPELHQLLSEFDGQTGCPVLVNTSFNVRGEPIVNSPSDAIRCFLGTGIDVLVIGNYFIQKTEELRRSSNKYQEQFELD